MGGGGGGLGGGNNGGGHRGGESDAEEDKMIARHAEVLARHQQGARFVGGNEAVHKKTEWHLGHRAVNFFNALNPMHDAAHKLGGGGVTAQHEGVHALDWFGHRARAQRQRQGLTLFPLSCLT